MANPLIKILTKNHLQVYHITDCSETKKKKKYLIKERNTQN